jgi:hypothetical protein
MQWRYWGQQQITEITTEVTKVTTDDATEVKKVIAGYGNYI